MESNLIGHCYVIENKLSGFIRPTIYLNCPVTDQYSQKLHGFNTVFEAQNFIKGMVGYGVAIEVSHEFQNVNEDAKLRIVRS